MTDPKPGDPRNPVWAERLAFVLRVLGASRYGLSAGEREDLAQEALLDLYERSRAEAPRNPEGLLRTIAHRKALDLFRARARWARRLGGDEVAGAEAPDPAPGPDAVLRARVLEALPALAETFFRARHPECLAHLYAYFDDGSWRDLAEARDARVNTVIKQWERCRREFVEHARRRGLAWALGEAVE